MTTRAINQLILICDGCGTERPKADSAMEARAAAYNDGWRYPPRRNPKSGTESLRWHDVCPSCYPTWSSSERSNA